MESESAVSFFDVRYIISIFSTLCCIICAGYLCECQFCVCDSVGMCVFAIVCIGGYIVRLLEN